MAKKDMAYDHPTYQQRFGEAMGEAGGAATTAYGKFVAFAAKRVYSVQATVTVAGTAAGHGLILQRIAAGGTATTALGTMTIGTATVGSTFNLLATSVPDGVALNAGDILQVASLADVVGKAAVAYEMQVQPTAQVTA